MTVQPAWWVPSLAFSVAGEKFHPVCSDSFILPCFKWQNRRVTLFYESQSPLLHVASVPFYCAKWIFLLTHKQFKSYFIGFTHRSLNVGPTVRSMKMYISTSFFFLDTLNCCGCLHKLGTFFLRASCVLTRNSSFEIEID